jgi:hypothetical protein
MQYFNVIYRSTHLAYLSELIITQNNIYKIIYTSYI